MTDDLAHWTVIWESQLRFGQVAEPPCHAFTASAAYCHVFRLSQTLTFVGFFCCHCNTGRMTRSDTKVRLFSFLQTLYAKLKKKLSTWHTWRIISSLSKNHNNKIHYKQQTGDTPFSLFSLYYLYLFDSGMIRLVIMINHKHDKPVSMHLLPSGKHARRTGCQTIRKTRRRSPKTERKHCARYLRLNGVGETLIHEEIMNFGECKNIGSLDDLQSYLLAERQLRGALASLKKNGYHKIYVWQSEITICLQYDLCFPMLH